MLRTSQVDPGTIGLDCAGAADALRRPRQDHLSEFARAAVSDRRPPAAADRRPPAAAAALRERVAAKE